MVSFPSCDYCGSIDHQSALDCPDVLRHHKLRGKRLPKPPARDWTGHACIDLETSGLPDAMQWKKHEGWEPEVLEVGATMLDGSATFRTYVCPSTDVWVDWRCRKALEVNGITRERCEADGVWTDQAANDLDGWMMRHKVSHLWCWRADIDFWFLRRGEWTGLLEGLTCRDAQAEVTALLTASGHVPPSKRGVSLQTAYALTAERTGARWDGTYHSALADAEMTGRVIRCLL